MNIQHAPTAITESRERLHEADTRLHGHWLLVARVVWISLVILTLAIFVVLLPSYFVQLQTVCVDTKCALVQPTTDAAQTMQKLGLSVSSYATFMFMLTIVTALVCFVVSAVVFWRKSDDWMALLFALTGVVLGTLYVTYTLQESHLSWRLLAVVSNVFGHGVIFLYSSLFPNGRFIPRWSGWIAIGWIIWSMMFFTLLHNSPFAYHILALVSGTACALIAQIYRYRYVSGSVQRQQTKWVVLGGSIASVMVMGQAMPSLIFPLLGQTDSAYKLLVGGPAALLAVLLISLSFGLAILRYRLYDIDILINRTLVYGLLTSTLALVYFGGVIALQSLLRGIISQDNGVAIVISTLVIAALFQPLRHHIQQLIDRRFYRRKYDATKIVAAFSSTLRSEVDLPTLSEHLLTVVQETMQPTSVSLWLVQREPIAGGSNEQ